MAEIVRDETEWDSLMCKRPWTLLGVREKSDGKLAALSLLTCDL